MAVVPVADLDAELAAAILAAARAAGLDPGERTARVVVVGNDGGRFWNLMSVAERSAPDPVDSYSAARVGEELAALGGDSVLLYPGPCSFSLQRLGAACGFGMPSYPGVSIDPSFGTWFAFRAVAVTTVELPATVPGGSTDICADCVSRDCLAACPAGAPAAPGRFDLDACIGHRLAGDSPCASDCRRGVRARSGPAGSTRPGSWRTCTSARWNRYAATATTRRVAAEPQQPASMMAPRYNPTPARRHRARVRADGGAVQRQCRSWSLCF
ncbi:MAG: hypothetical protein M5U09_16740 [Gammaproteobacteria bacterium]|nr:hypothetical protein [Gammaproteobacteria bacterium]